MQIQFNDEPMQCAEGQTVSGLLTEFNQLKPGAALALNQQILPALSQQLLSHMAAGQKPRQVTLGYHEEEGVVMAFDEGTISDE